MTSRLVAAVAFVAVFAACGSSGSGISRGASGVLARDVDAIRAAVDAGDRNGAVAALGALDRHVAALNAAHQLSDSAARRVLGAAIDVGSELRFLTPATTTSSMPPASVTPPPGPRRDPRAKHGKHGDGGD